MGFTFFLILTFFGLSSATLCTQMCDQASPPTPNGFTFNACGFDLEDHLKIDISKYTCYLIVCNVSLLYPGSCGCPNDCSKILNRGECVNQTCQCSPGWGGRDCSSIRCPSNCGGHGECISDPQVGDYCRCAPGWVGPNCDVQMSPKLNSLVFGEFFHGNYYQKDEFKDHHPVFNVSTIANVRITMNNSYFMDMLNLQNLFEQDYFPASLVFDNGQIVEKVDRIGFKIKGFVGSRVPPKKAFKIEFNYESGIKWKGMKKIGLKTADDLLHINDMLISLWNRAMQVETYRGSYTSLYINDIFMGLYWMHEELDDLFLKSRFGGDKGNLYKMNLGCLDYAGDDPETYKNMSFKLLDTIEVKKKYDQTEGDGNFSDLTGFIQAINQSNIGDFEADINSLLNVESLLRSLVIDNLVGGWDGYQINCNNYLLYNDPKTEKFIWFTHDYTISLYRPPSLLTPGFTYYSNASILPYLPQPVLAIRILQVPRWKERYLQIYSELVNEKWNLQIINEQMDLWTDTLASFVTLDTFGKWQSTSDFNQTAIIETSKIWLANRTLYAQSQLPPFSLVNFIPFWIGIAALVVVVVLLGVYGYRWFTRQWFYEVVDADESLSNWKHT